MQPRHPHDDNVKCDLCGEQQFDMLHAWEVGNFWNPASIPIAVWQCRSCEVVMLHPVPTAEQLPAAGEWWTSERKFYRRRPWLKRMWKPTRVAIFGSKESRLIRKTRRLVPEGRLLDVGCGLGELMQEGRKHYDCVGLDPSPVGVHALGMVAHVDIPKGEFDAVMMDSVLEHVHSPTGVLAKVNHALRIGGAVVINVPKFNGPAYRRHGAGWNGFRHGYHTFLYTGQTLGKFLEKTGFEVVQNPKRDRILDDILTLWGRKVRDVAGEFDTAIAGSKAA